MTINDKKITLYLYVLAGMLVFNQACKSASSITKKDNSSTDKITQASNNLEIKKEKSYTETVPGTVFSFEMIGIPKGKFMMGSPASEKNRRENEGPVREVELDAFYIGKYELTWELFELFFKQNKELFVKLENDKVMKVDAITRPSPPYEDPSYGMGKEGYPAVSMSTYSALVYCKWLSTVTGKFYRLPTEAEWEYAARAGSATAYSFGNDPALLNEYAVYRANSNNVYAKVGTKKPNAWGLYDMHGNAAEWTLDEFKEDAYSTLGAKNPWATPMVIHPRVFRGGSWDDTPDKLRSASRTGSSLKLQKRDPQIPKSFWWFTDSNYIGFRLVSPAVQPSSEEQKKFWQAVLDE